jgi:hypothetical protein
MQLHHLAQKSALFVATILALPSLSFASGATVCYQATQRVPSEVPTLLCLESIHESAQAKTLEIESQNASMPKTVTITTFSRHNEERYSFAAESLIVNEDASSYCSRTLQATLKIAGKSNYGTIDPASLAVSVEVAYNPDVCNVSTFVDLIPYSRVGAIR